MFSRCLTLLTLHFRRKKDTIGKTSLIEGDAAFYPNKAPLIGQLATREMKSLLDQDLLD